MKKSILFLTLGLMIGLLPDSIAQKGKTPHVGYLYPAGGKRGTTFQIIAGGRSLNAARSVTISGDGVTAKILNITTFRVASKEDRDDRRTTRVELQKLLKGFKGANKVIKPRTMNSALDKFNSNELKSYPFHANLDTLAMEGIQLVLKEFSRRDKEQKNAQISETKVLQITIAPGAKPGIRELRFIGSQTISNPIRFQVGFLDELRETEPNAPELRLRPEVKIPALINGQIMPGDVDRFRFQAKKGQKLVMDLHARRLIPYLADAVPGWFQATLAVFNEAGEEIAFQDDFQFNPDPVLFLNVPKDGTYFIEVKDSIFRGRQDFVYRLSVGELPYVTSVFPLGTKVGSQAEFTISGYNIPVDSFSLKADEPSEKMKKSLQFGPYFTNPICLSVGLLPETVEAEPNNKISEAQHIDLPKIINGKISRAGDRDVFHISGLRGQKIVVELYGRRLDSPVDSVLHLLDNKGKMVAMNDDFVTQNSGDLTHNADSYLMVELPKDGDYYIFMTEAQGQGGAAYSYRLRLSKPIPDFVVHTYPSTIILAAGKTVPLKATIIRKDGFDKPVMLAVADAPGLSLNSATLLPGQKTLSMTLTAAPDQKQGMLPFIIKAESDGIVRKCIPSEDVMQAFLYRHLMTTHSQVASITRNSSWLPSYTLVNPQSLSLVPGEKVSMTIKATKPVKRGKVTLELVAPPKGMTLEDLKYKADQISFSIATSDEVPHGISNNLIIRMTYEYSTADVSPKAAARKRKLEQQKKQKINKAARGKKKKEMPAVKGKNPKKRARMIKVSLGTLPAIPFKVVEKQK